MHDTGNAHDVEVTAHDIYVEVVMLCLVPWWLVLASNQCWPHTYKVTGEYKRIHPTDNPIHTTHTDSRQCPNGVSYSVTELDDLIPVRLTPATGGRHYTQHRGRGLIATDTNTTIMKNVPTSYITLTCSLIASSSDLVELRSITDSPTSES